MPTSSTIPGRIQLVTGGEPPRETQVPYLHLVPEDENDPGECAIADKAVAWARALATSGTVAKIPVGGEFGVPEQLLPPCVADQLLSSQTPSEQPGSGIVVRQDPPQPPALTLREAVERDVFGDRKLGAVRKAVERAELQPAGKRGNALTYLLTDLHALAKGIQ